MLYQLDTYYKSLVNNRYAYFIIRKTIQKLRYKISTITATNPKSFNVIIKKNI